MAKTYYIKFRSTPGSLGSLIEYRQVDSPEWILPQSPPNPTAADQYPLQLDENATYYVAVSAIGKSCTRKRRIITVSVPAAGACCPEGFTLAPDESYCYQTETTPADVISSGICLTYAKNSEAYSRDGAKIYNPGYSASLPVSNSFVLLTSAYWTGNPPGWGDISNPDPQPGESVMNRDAVWIDSDCNGTKDALAVCSVLQFTYLINLPSPKRLYVGMGGDNTFRLDLNNITIVKCEAGPTGYTDPGGGPNCATAPPANSATVSNLNFNYWHIIPLDLLAGPNYLNFSATGDGSINDAFAAIVYDNTAAELIAAESDQDLNILFRTGDYKGTSVDIATCPPGWSLDTTPGSGNYVCRRITTSPVISC